MEITPVNLNPIRLASIGTKTVESPQEKALDSFAGILKDTISKVSDVQKGADTAVERFVAGEIDIHEVMIEVEKASVALQLTVQVRNKIMEAYQEVMRMQI